jgi:hypothetical protein
MQRAWLVLVISVAAGACGGPQIPQHNGYKDSTTKPWKKFKTFKFDDKGEAKSDGDLSYPDRRRAAWFGIDVATPSALTVKLDITPPGDAVNEDFDLGVELLDPANRPLQRKDLEEGDSQHDLNKSLDGKELQNLQPGHYLLHLYLQGRLDSCEFTIHATLKSSGAGVEVKSDFPSQVAFVPPLPLVPVTDDTPKNYKPPTTTPVVITHHHGTAPPPPPVKPPPPTAVSARIIGVAVGGGGTTITIARGTSSGSHNGQTGKVLGVAGGTFSLANCNERSCQATISGVTPDQITHSGQVTLDQ